MRGCWRSIGVEVIAQRFYGRAPTRGPQCATYTPWGRGGGPTSRRMQEIAVDDARDARSSAGGIHFSCIRLVDAAASTVSIPPAHGVPDVGQPRVMPSLHSVVAHHGGLVATHELYTAGWTRNTLATEVHRGRLLRVRTGWFALPHLHPTLVRIARVGGPATCVTGLQLHGAWVVPVPELHVRVAEHASRLRDPRDRRQRLTRGAVVHWRSSDRTPRLLLDPIDCLDDMLGCQLPELIAATADSVLREHPSDLGRWQVLAASAPTTLRPALLRVDGVCESGTETIVWQRLGRSLELRRQLVIPGIGRVDFVLGDRLVIEVDGFAYHSDPTQFEADRRRDAALSALGYRVLRFSYHQVLHRWAEVEAAIRAAVARGDQF